MIARVSLYSLLCIAVLFPGILLGASQRPAAIAGPERVTGDGQHFNCGTYKGNQNEIRWHHQRYQAQKRQFAAGMASPAPATSEVYDDVWIVEDDGTVLITGNNQFQNSGTSIRFAPNGSGYDVTSGSVNFVAPFGTDLLIEGDDADEIRALQFGFDFYGTTWNEIHIGSNGSVALGGVTNPSGFYDSNDFFGTTPTIAPYSMDLDPTAAFSGGVVFLSTPDSAVVTWSDIAEWGQSARNTFQLVLRSDGSFEFKYLSILSKFQQTGAPIVVGASPGGEAPILDRIDYSAALPVSGAPGHGFYEDYFVITDPVVSESGLGHKFYENFPDDFFQYVYFSLFNQTMGGFANEFNIENSVSGIGLPIFDNSASYGSGGALESRCNMNNLGVWFTDPTQRFTGGAQQNFLTIMGQESVHRWGAFVKFEDGGGQESNLILGRSDAHWSFYLDVDHSILEGGDWDLVSTDFYRCNTWVDYCSDLDEYLMGLRDAEEVKPMFYVSSSSNNIEGNRDNPPPVPNNTASGTPVPVTIDDIIANEGLRTPTPATEVKDLRQAFILITLNGQIVSQANKDKIAGFRRAWEDYFEYSCDGRMSVNTSVTQTYPVAGIEGRVIDRTTTLPISSISVTSLGRGFVQNVPEGGRYAFRYMANENSGPYEAFTVEVSAPGYYPESVAFNVTYGFDIDWDFKLDPVTTPVDPARALPTTLYQNFPNPFNPTTSIPFDLAQVERVRLAIYNVQGQLVRTLVDEYVNAGHHRPAWDGTDNNGNHVTSGVYVYRLTAGSYRATQKMVMVK
jgi:hypothetical protein